MLTSLPGAASPMKPARRAARAPHDITGIAIPVIAPTPGEAASDVARERGQFLARQDRWEELAAELDAADRARQATPDGQRLADLLAFGARSDAILAAEHALQDGADPDAPALAGGIAALEEMRDEAGAAPMLDLVVALAHLDLGWLWRRLGQTHPTQGKTRFAAHVERAAALLAPHCGVTLDSPAIAAARCAILAGSGDPRDRLVDDFEDLIDLDPGNPRPMRTLGTWLLPRWFGDYRQLELEARRTAALTQDVWGAGGYTWVCFDAVAIDDGACTRIDTGFFIDGLLDILKARPDQAMVNLLTAYCALALRPGPGDLPDARRPRAEIAACASRLIRGHLTELHPLVWAHAGDRFDDAAPATSLKRYAARGQSEAMQVLAAEFSAELAAGRRVAFTPDGVVLRAP